MQWLGLGQKVKVEGSYQYHIQPSTHTPDSATSLTLTAYADSQQKALIPCHYTWFTLKNGIAKEVSHLKGCTFPCDPVHIGYHIQAHVVSNDPDHPGKAIATFPPVRVDPALKTTVLNALAARSLTLPVSLIRGKQQVEGNLQLFEAQIRLSHRFRDLAYLFQYSILEPQFSTHPHDPTRGQLSFSQKYQDDLGRFQRAIFPTELPATSNPGILQLAFVSKAGRDAFFLTLKAFLTRRELRSMAVIHKIQNINFEKQEEFGAALEVDSLRRDLVRLDGMYQGLSSEKNRLQQEVNRSTMDKSRSRGGSGSDLERQNRNLWARVRQLTQEAEQSRLNRSGVSTGVRRDQSISLAHLLDDLDRTQHEEYTVQQLSKQKRQLQDQLQQSQQRVRALEQATRHSTIPPSYNRPQVVEFALQPPSPPPALRTRPKQPFNSPTPSRRGLGEVRSEGKKEWQHGERERLQGRCRQLQRRVGELEWELDAARQSQDMLNRSQHVSQQMDDYHSQQVRILKQHNQFLLSQNDKLVNACEKYMSQAKQSNKLRQQIIQLRQKLLRQHQASSFLTNN